MLVQLIFLTLALSIDALSIGLSYGVRKIKLSPLSIIIISAISLIFSSSSIYFGKFLSQIFSEKITSFTSILILIFLGIFIIKKGIENNEKDKQIIKEKIIKKKKYSIFLKSFGLTINIIKSPAVCDMDNSMKIEPKEAFYLGTALSIDCIGVGIAVSSLNTYANLFPILIMIFQIIFLNCGMFVGKKINLNKLDENKLSIISGLILIFIGFIRILFS